MCCRPDEVLGKYRRHKTNVTGSDVLNAIALEDNLMPIALVESRYPELSNLVRKKRQIALMSRCKRYWFHDRKKALYYLKAAYFSGGLISFLRAVISWEFKRKSFRGANL